MSSVLLATRLLKRRLSQRVSVEEESRFRASFDGSKLSFMPAAVVRPRTRSDITAVLTLANRYGVPVTVRGGGTSLTGSGSPLRGGWVLDLSGWKRIRLDAEAGTVDVQAGVVVADLQRAAETAGWFYPPDPASKQYSTVGGNIACNAGGMHGGKYGVTRDFVLALRGFLPTGEYVEWGTRHKEICRRVQSPGPLDRQRGHARGRDRGHAETHPAAGGAMDTSYGVSDEATAFRAAQGSLRPAYSAGDL
jgi:glycolate oxidase